MNRFVADFEALNPPEHEAPETLRSKFSSKVARNTMSLKSSLSEEEEETEPKVLSQVIKSPLPSQLKQNSLQERLHKALSIKAQ